MTTSKKTYGFAELSQDVQDKLINEYSKTNEADFIITDKNDPDYTDPNYQMGTMIESRELEYYENGTVIEEETDTTPPAPLPFVLEWDESNLELEDSDALGMYWDDFKSALDEQFKILLAVKKGRDMDGFFITAKGLGWQKRDGEKTINFEDAEEFITEVFPDTDITISRAAFYEDRAEFTVSHHDSHGEFYNVVPVFMCEYCADTKANSDNRQAGTDDEHICDYCLGDKYLSNEQAFQSFLGCFEGGLEELKERYEDDNPMYSESWNDYKDGLCKNGDITNKQYMKMPSVDELIKGCN